MKVGDRVLIDPNSDHPWAGHTGTVVRLEIMGLLPHLGPRPVVQITGKYLESFITQDDQATVIGQPKKERDKE